MTEQIYGPHRPTDTDVDRLSRELDRAETAAADTYVGWGFTPADSAAAEGRVAVAAEGLISALRISMEHPEPEPEAGA